MNMSKNEQAVNILLVEDDEGHSRLVRNAFRSSDKNMNLTVVSSLKEAREYLTESTPHLVITDLHLPDGKGIELLNMEGESLFPIIITTSHGDERLAVEAMKTGALDYVVKSAATFKDMPHIAERALREWNHMIKHRQAEETIAENKERFRSIVDTASDAIISINSHGKITFWNNAAENIFGYTAVEIVGKPVTILMPDHYHEAHLEGIKRAVKSKLKLNIKTVELMALRKNGDEFPIEISLSSWQSKDSPFFTGIARDITERTKTQDQLHRQALHDQLTDLPNRVLFNKRLRRLLMHSSKHGDCQFAVFFIDLDRFKIINDSLGHMIGDKLIMEVARRLENCVRPNDTVARFGGDEFAVLLDEIKKVSDATIVADRIIQELSVPYDLNGHEITTSASIGIALSATGYDSGEDIIRDADSAMYRAKALGKARYEIFDSEMHAYAIKLLHLEADLRQAVIRNEFKVYYQPVVSLEKNSITGVEALLRWQHPQRGFVPPHEFIPLAEEIGLISTIGESVLRTACSQNKAWMDAGYENLLMKVNISERQILNKDFLELVKQVLQETGMPARLLDIEITESAIKDDYGILVLNTLSDMGIQVSIDDFGTGYSSFGSLKHFPINTIKIDLSFIKDITVDFNTEAIIKAIVAMAHTLKIKVIAEGVETKEQLLFLMSIMCSEAQGYFFSQPVPEEKFIELLKNERAALLQIKQSVKNNIVFPTT